MRDGTGNWFTSVNATASVVSRDVEGVGEFASGDAGVTVRISPHGVRIRAYVRVELRSTSA